MLNDLRWIRQTRRTCFGHSKLTRSPYVMHWLVVVKVKRDYSHLIS